MDCPKCGTPQTDEREECSACGVVFERWREAQDRALLQSRVDAAQPLPEPAAHVPAWMIFAGIIVVVLLGFTWTLMSRAARVRRDAKADMIADDINKEINRPILAARAAAAAASAHASVDIEPPPAASPNAAAPVPGWPEGFNDALARAILERCSAFSAPAAGSGRRRVASFSNVEAQGDTASADYTSIGEAGGGEGAGAPSTGHVKFSRAGGGWVLQSVTVGTGESAVPICN